MNSKKYLFIGCGNMGEPVLHAFLQSGVNPEKITVIEKTAERQSYLREKYAVTVKDDVSGVEADVVILAIKPQQLLDIPFSSISLAENSVVVSILAGTPIARINTLTGISSIIRFMPNLPLMVGKGMTSMVSQNISPEEKNFFKQVFSQGGEVVELESEDQMHVATLIAGSGPGFYYYFCSVFETLAQKQGFSKEDAMRMAKQTFIGAAAYAESSEKTSEELVTMVASKGGTTEATLKAFEEMQLPELFEKAIEQGIKRSRELSK